VNFVSEIPNAVRDHYGDENHEAANQTKEHEFGFFDSR